VKATSSAARIAPQLLGAKPDARVVYMYLNAEPYLATLLAGENSPVDLNGHRVERASRLAALLGEDPPPVTGLGELAALSWLAERLTMATVVTAHGARVMPLDFDAMLGDVAGTTRNVTNHLGLTIDAARSEAIAHSLALTRYSKAPEHEYSPSFRAEILAQSRALNAAEIRKGLEWLAKVGARNPKIGALAMPTTF
jgi:hypothetical protein